MHCDQHNFFNGVHSIATHISFLLVVHLVQQRTEPVFKGTVVHVGNDEVSNTVHSPFPQFLPLERKVAHVVWLQALEKVFFNAASSRYDCIDLGSQGMRNQGSTIRGGTHTHKKEALFEITRTILC